jgi:hypothetical protein
MGTVYRGLVKDDLKALETKTTKWYDTYEAAHTAAEKLCKRTMGDRGTIAVEEARENEDLNLTDAEIKKLVEFGVSNSSLAENVGMKLDGYASTFFVILELTEVPWHPNTRRYLITNTKYNKHVDVAFDEYGDIANID